MEFAIVNGHRSVPLKGLKGECQVCGKLLIAKCGSQKLHHWAHSSQFHCDTWWENETPWHRQWKSHFDEKFHEKVFHDPVTNEKHIADVFTDEGITIEFQNSPMSLEELQQRESFYKKMIWVVNAKTFEKNIQTGANIPSFKEFQDDDFVFRSGSLNVVVWKKSDNPDYSSTNMVWLRSLKEFPEIQNLLPTNNFSFEWKKARQVWFDSKVPVFFDMGDGTLFWLRERVQKGVYPFRYITVINKTSFLQKYAK